MTGVLKMPLPVWKLHGSPTAAAGVTVLRPSCRLSRRNFGHGLSGSSGTSY
jgi:hypothetical protein